MSLAALADALIRDRKHGPIVAAIINGRGALTPPSENVNRVWLVEQMVPFDGYPRHFGVNETMLYRRYAGRHELLLGLSMIEEAGCVSRIVSAHPQPTVQTSLGLHSLEHGCDHRQQIIDETA